MTRQRQLTIRPEPRGIVPRTAMVMAAGLGKRMRPLTATRPKPLVEVAGKALIDHVFARLRAAGIERVVVNVHYLADTLQAHLAGRYPDMEVLISDERDQLLETGGGLAKARPLLGDDPVLVVNGDSLWVDGPVDAIKLLASRWDASAMDVLMLMVPFARANNLGGMGDFRLAPDGRVMGRRKPGTVAPFAYIGVQIIDPAIIVDVPEGPFSTNLFWDRAIAAGRAYGQVHQGMWFEVGTPASIPRTEAMLAHG